MIIPNFQNSRFVNKDGYLTDEWQNIFQALITALQQNLSDEGFLVPQQSAANIAKLQTAFAASTNPATYNGDLIYDSTNDLLKVNIAGTFKTVTTS